MHVWATRNCSGGLVVSWYSDCVYNGRIYTYSSRGGDNCRFGKNNQRKTDILTYERVVKKESSCAEKEKLMHIEEK